MKMKLLDKFLIKIIIIYFLSIFYLYSGSIFAFNPYNTKFYNIDIISNNISSSKSDEIQKIKIKAFLEIIDKLLIYSDKNKLIKKINYEQDLEKTIKNIIIENENITQNSYKAKIKVNFYQNEIINLFRNYKINYTDIASDPFLLIVTFSDEFNNIGLSKNNPFYDLEKIDILSDNKNLLKLILPDLSINDRYILPYNKITTNDLNSLNQISKKYNINNFIIFKIKKIDTDYYKFNTNIFSLKNNEFYKLEDFKTDSIANIQQKFISFINDWWKNRNLIKIDKINTIVCSINSIDYDDLIEIKSKIKNLSQFKSSTINTISLNNNTETISYYGSFDIFSKNLSFKNLQIKNNDICTINSIN